MKKFQTIGQAKKIARKSIRINTIKWLEAAAEDGFTKEKNFLLSLLWAIKHNFIKMEK